MNAVMDRYLTPAEQTRLLNTAHLVATDIARRDYAWLLLLISTGLRIGEFSKMTVRDAVLALQTGYIFIPKEHRKGKRRDHSVLVTKPVKEALNQLLWLRDGVAHSEPLVGSRKHGALTPRGYQQRMKYWALHAGLPAKASPHWCRHTRAKNIMRKTTSNNAQGIVQAALGHVTIASTGMYTKVSKEELEPALLEVDGEPKLRKRDMRRVYEGAHHAA